MGKKGFFYGFVDQVDCYVIGAFLFVFVDQFYFFGNGRDYVLKVGNLGFGCIFFVYQYLVFYCGNEVFVV